MATNIHSAYVQSLLNGGSLVKTRGGRTLAFRHKHDMVHGGGFWSNLWGKAKSFASKVIPTVVGIGKDALMSGIGTALGGQGSIKDRLSQGLRAAAGTAIGRKDDLLDAAKLAAGFGGGSRSEAGPSGAGREPAPEGGSLYF